MNMTPTPVSTTSSGVDTFLFFDDFTGASLDPHWDDVMGSPSVSDSMVSLSEHGGVDDRIRAGGYGWNTGVQMHLRLRYSNDAALVGRTGLARAGVSTMYYSDDCAYMNPTGGVGDVNTVTGDDGANAQWIVYYTYMADTWYEGSIKWVEGSVLYTFDGATRNQTSRVPDEGLSPRLEGTSSAESVDVDWVFVGRYVYPEPVLSSWGGEEAGPRGDVLLNLTYVYDGAGSVTQIVEGVGDVTETYGYDLCLLYTSPSPRDRTRSRMPSSA